MELRQLRAFVAVAAEGHFGRAAARLNLTQPGLTLRIQALEKEIGAQLLERSAREVQLTPAGVALLPHAKSLLRIEDRALREVKDQAEGVAGSIRISYLSYGAVSFPGRLVAEFRRRHPNARVETTSGHSGLNAERLREGIVDAAFVHPGFIGIPGDLPEGVAVRLLARDRVMVALPANHPLSRQDAVSVKALAKEPLVVFPSTPFQSFSLKLEHWLARHMGARPKIVAYEPPDHALDAVAHSTSLITFANASRATSTPVPGIEYRRLSPELLIDFGLAYFRDDESHLLADLLRLIDEMAPGEPGEVPEGSEVLHPGDVPTEQPSGASRHQRLGSPLGRSNGGLEPA